MRAPPLPAPGTTVPGFVAPMRPLSFIGKGGRAPKLVEIWEVKHVIFSNDPSARMVAAYDRKKKIWVGTVDMRRRPARHSECQDDFDAVAARIDIDRSHVFQISGAALLEPYQGHRIGVAMYLGAAALAKKENLAIVGDACFGSSTSQWARNVWKSKEFNEHVVRSELVAALK